MSLAQDARWRAPVDPGSVINFSEGSERGRFRSHELLETGDDGMVIVELEE